MVAARKYPDELRERAIRLAVEARRDPASRTGACKRIGGRVGINPETLRGWVTQAEVDQGTRPGTTSDDPGTTSDDAARLAELEKENRELRRTNAILRSASVFFRSGARPPVSLILDYIEAHKDDFGVQPICTAPQQR